MLTIRNMMCVGLLGAVVAGAPGCSVEDAPYPIPPTPQPESEPDGVELMRTARLLPVYESGEMIAIVISHIAPESTWDALGLEDGDRIVAVGGIPIRSPAAGAEALQFIAAHRSRLRAIRVSEREVELLAGAP